MMLHLAKVVAGTEIMHVESGLFVRRMNRSSESFSTELCDLRLLAKFSPGKSKSFVTAGFNSIKFLGVFKLSAELRRLRFYVSDKNDERRL